MYLRKLELRYMKEQKEIEKLNQKQQPPWLVNNIIICYKRETNTGNDSGRKQHFLQHEETHSDIKEAYTDESKSTGRKIGFAAAFADNTRRGVLPEKASIYIAEMKAMR